MGDCQRQNPVEWDAPTKDAGGAEYTVWEAKLELEPCEADAGPTNLGAVSMLQKSVRIKVYVDDRKVHVQSQQAEEATEAARNVYEE